MVEPVTGSCVLAKGTSSSFGTSAGLILLVFSCELPMIELENGEHPELAEVGPECLSSPNPVNGVLK